ncbi:MAG: SIS domain-containing protein [Candidatus Omnitrophica bacterium]|nr:SIS domain-containing protein [Candidatus Omnitrophota bacterium]
MNDSTNNFLKESADIISAIAKNPPGEIELIAHVIINAFKNNSKVLIFGNGGSASDAEHFTAELIGRFKMERKGLAAIALTTNTAALSALANDYNFDIVFERQIEALGSVGDIAIGISTSGQAVNVIKGFKLAKKLGLTTIALSGQNGTNLKEITDLTLLIQSTDTPHIQEAHILIIHTICKIVEEALFT